MDLDINTAARELASRISECLSLEQESPSNSPLFTIQQTALLNDSYGLLLGISNGTVVTGQRRIRDNLIQVLQEAAGFQGVDEHKSVLNKIYVILSRAAAVGLTAENHNIDKRIREWTR